MENARGFVENYGTVHTEDDRIMQGSGHTNINVQSDTLWSDMSNDLRKGDLHSWKKSYVPFENLDTLVYGDKKTFDAEDSKNFPIPAHLLNVSHQEKDRDHNYVASGSPSLGKVTFLKCTCDCHAVSKGTSECDSTDKNFEHRSAALKICGDSETVNRSIGLKSKDGGLFSEDTKMEPVQTERKNILPMPKSFSDVADNPKEPDSSSVDVLEDETFMSFTSGSFYSRSSSSFSLADSTDIEQCVFEEALEDLSSLSLDRQFQDSSIVPNADVQSPLWDTSMKYKKHPASEQISKTAISKQKNTSCNIDPSWGSPSYNGEQSQAIKRSTQDIGVNTDPIQHGWYSQVSASNGMGTAKDVEESKTSGHSSSPSPEALLQRAVKAELQLLDVHRWLCWQMCWKTRQQTIEKQLFFNLSNEPIEPSTSMTNFNLSSALAEVEGKYQEMRAKIESGVPLDTLVPLISQLFSMETSTDNLAKVTLQQSRKQNVSDVPAEDVKKDKSVTNNFEDSFLSCVDKYEQKPNEIHSAEHLSEKPSHYYVHVGNIASCVKEVQVIEIFKKYHVLDVFLEESSLTCSYAVLTFSKSEDAKAAKTEMDGKMFYGKKLKIRDIKTPNYNISLTFQKIKSVSKEISQDGKGRTDTLEPKEDFALQPPKSISTRPNPVQCDQAHAAPVFNTLTNTYINVPINKGYPDTSTYFRPPAVPAFNTFGFSNNMTPNYQWMVPAHHSNMLSYNGMPKLMCVPFSYPLYTLPNHHHMSAVTHPPVPTVTHPPVPTATHPPNFGISKKPNVHNQFYENYTSHVRSKLVKPTCGTDQPSNLGFSVSAVPNQVQFPTDKTELLKKDTGVNFMEDKPATVKFASDLESLTTSSSAKPQHSETASQDDSFKSCASVSTADVLDVGTANIDSLSSDEPKNISGPPNFKCASPLRSPTFVPRSVTIPYASKPSVKANFNFKVLTPSEKQAEASSSVTSLQGDSLPAEKMDWGVYPKLDPLSELPIFINPNQLNFAQFKRVIKHLVAKHKDFTRDQIVKTLEEVRCIRGGSFCGLTIPEIILAVSSKLTGDIPPA